MTMTMTAQAGGTAAYDKFNKEDTDEYRLPEGLTRIGYDADTQTYTFRDHKDNSTWESESGNRYGKLHKVKPDAGIEGKKDTMFAPDSIVDTVDGKPYSVEVDVKTRPRVSTFTSFDQFMDQDRVSSQAEAEKFENREANPIVKLGRTLSKKVASRGARPSRRARAAAVTGEEEEECEKTALLGSGSRRGTI